MRLENIGLISSIFDYWRIYDCGIGDSVESFRDDWRREGETVPPHLTPNRFLISLHSLLAHARLVGQDTSGVAQVVIRMDWRGLKGCIGPPTALQFILVRYRRVARRWTPRAAIPPARVTPLGLAAGLARQLISFLSKPYQSDLPPLAFLPRVPDSPALEDGVNRLARRD